MGKEKHKEFIVYRIYHIDTGKSYIGITGDYKQRMYDHFNCRGHCRYLYNAIKKYGKENFKHEIVFECNSWEESCREEIEYIRIFNTKSPKGYNLTDGGDGNIGLKWPIESRKKKSESSKSLFNDQIIEIKKMLYDQISIKKIAKKFNVSYSTISRIKRGKYYSEIQCSGINLNNLPKGGRKFFDNQIIEIKKMIYNKILLKKIAKKFNVSYATISCIKNGKYYSDIQCPGINIDDLPKGHYKLVDNQIIEIKKMLNEGISQQIIAKKFNVKPPTISYINTGKYYKNIN